MLINFLHPCFQPEIRCNSVATEGYEISNLTSNNLLLSDKGFLAERFISSPVEINVKLTCPVYVQRIIIWTKVSNQKSIGVELSTRISSHNDHTIHFKRFASTIVPDQASGIVFEREGPSTLHSDNSRIFSFHRSTFYRGKNHEKVTELLVKIFKFQYVAAVKKIEVWGQPHKSCDRKTKAFVYNVWKTNQKTHAKKDDTLVCGDTNDNSVQCLSHISNDAIPEEFCDEITREIMTLPMILPSGKIVDYRTLEKFQNEEAQWGRPPSDPFTGLAFTAGRKPVVATSLKLNIDSFCAQNSNLNDIKTVPRRLGTRHEYAYNGIRISELLDENRSCKRKLQAPNYYEEGKSDVFSKEENDMKKLKLVSFLNAPEEKRNFTEMCFQCMVSTISNLYKLPCSHIICRYCLTNCENKCRKCKLSFLSGDVEKIHFFEHA